MRTNLRAIEHYNRWTRTQFRASRLYVFMVSGVTGCALVIQWLVALKVEEKFEWDQWLQISALFSGFGFLLIFVVRKAAISASWIVAKQAQDLIRAGEGDKAWTLLLARYTGIHPLVINDRAFHEILIAAALASDDLRAREIANQSVSLSQSQHEHIESKAKRAAIFIIVCFVLMFLVGIIRVLLR